jgi:hypothetical protein
MSVCGLEDKTTNGLFSGMDSINFGIMWNSF